MVKVTDLITDRLMLREINLEDTTLIVEWRSDPTVYRYFRTPHPLKKEEHLNWYHNNYVFNPDRIDFMAVRKDAAKPVGVFGIRREGPESRQAEVSYLLAPDELGKGYASEAVTALEAYVKTKWNCEKVIAEIHKDNHSSIRFVKRLGYRLACHQEVFGIYEKELW